MIKDLRLENQGKKEGRVADNPESAENRHELPFNINALTLDQLTALGSAVEERRRERLKSEVEEVVAGTRAALAKLGLTLEEAIRLTSQTVVETEGKRIPNKSGNKVPVKYRSPSGEEWSGRGRTPRWLAAAEDKGKKREEFLS